MLKFLRRIYQHIKGGPSREIEPDEIFIDSSNLPKFDTHQLEGHLEKPLSKKVIRLTGLFFLLIGLVFTYKAGELQIVQGSHYRELSSQNRLEYKPVFSQRGVIKDRKGEKLAWNAPNKGKEYPLRKYTDKPGMAHILGYVKYPAKDESGVYYREKFKGKRGIEKYVNDTLSGKNGLKIIERNALSEIQSETTIHSKENGKSIKLSIDAKLQSTLYKFIKNTAKRYNFKGDAGIIMNVNTGEILTATNYPEYDPEVMSRGKPKKIINSYQKSRKNPLLNRVFSGVYTPGSIVKPFMAVAALEEGVISPQKEILSTGSISVPNPYHPGQESVFMDWKTHGWVDMREALAVSSNEYFYQIGGGYKDQEGLGIRNIDKYMRMFGFGKKTGLKLQKEESGVVPSPQWKKRLFKNPNWRLGDTYNTAIGQYGFQVTPLQMARGIAAIANGGKLLTPTLIKGKNKKGKKLPMEKAHFKVVREGMRTAVKKEKGTASGLDVGYVKVAAKTGTAELNTTGKGKVNSWVIGFFPYKNPQYSFAVVMGESYFKNHIGGVYVMRQMLDWMHRNAPKYFKSKTQ